MDINISLLFFLFVLRFGRFSVFFFALSLHCCSFLWHITISSLNIESEGACVLYLLWTRATIRPIQKSFWSLFAHLHRIIGISISSVAFEYANQFGFRVFARTVLLLPFIFVDSFFLLYFILYLLCCVDCTFFLSVHAHFLSSHCHYSFVSFILLVFFALVAKCFILYVVCGVCVFFFVDILHAHSFALAALSRRMQTNIQRHISHLYIYRYTQNLYRRSDSLTERRFDRI